MTRLGKRNRRRILFERSPQCYWCGCEVIWVEQSGGQLPHNAATLDHLYDKLNEKRGIYLDNKERTVLACSQCNWQRGQDSLLKLSVKERRLRQQKIMREKKERKRQTSSYWIHGIEHAFSELYAPQYNIHSHNKLRNIRKIYYKTLRDINDSSISEDTSRT